ncbi:hypothetical protein FDG2_4967 [Candidatus Protofrankia californiensis]|uniref:Uncharacterized protein n=1 Tax=Candidatus Protofrankia californiensis TaxID=1839754 RepID=A0A1C3PA56_9ACTN|nr:hypothetical protein FDG2_4967 [Candidatus Protofrankia californiensis]
MRRSGRTTWDVADVEQWLLEFLAGRPDLELHYPARHPTCGRLPDAYQAVRSRAGS